MLAEVKLDIYNDEIDNSLATDKGRSTEPPSKNSEHEAELFAINGSEADSQNDNIPAALKATYEPLNKNKQRSMRLKQKVDYVARILLFITPRIR